MLFSAADGSLLLTGQTMMAGPTITDRQCHRFFIGGKIHRQPHDCVPPSVTCQASE